MPDENKLRALESAGFKVRRTCYRCALYDAGAQGWGTCRAITYEHKKHTKTDKPRQASVPVDGWCYRHQMRPDCEAMLGAHRRFVERGNGGGGVLCGCGAQAAIYEDDVPVCGKCSVSHRIRA